MATLQLHFFGPPEVDWQNQTLSFPARKALALLVYLVVEGGMQSREKLAALLWPESDPSRARATLRNGLHQLRSTVPGDHFLHVERDALGFNFAADYALDLETVETAVAADDLDRLAAAIAAYRGEFLEGFILGNALEFDDWVRLQQEQWRRRIDVIFDRLSQKQLEGGNIETARDTAESWLAHNPLNEAAYRRLMRLYLAAGQRAAALAVYEQCGETLRQELDVAPSPETEALAARIQENKIAEWQSGKVASSSAVGSSSVRQPHFGEGPLVGRRREFGALLEAFHRAGREGPGAIRLVGEAGIGKTRLAREFLAWAAAEGGDVLRGRSFESSRRLPYQPLVAALRPRLQQVNAPEDLLSDTWLRALSRLLPELLDRYPDLAAVSPPAMDEAAARTHLYEAISRVLVALAAQTPESVPLVLFLDDLQWADGATLDVLQYAAHRWGEEGAPILLLCTVRVGEAGAAPVASCWEQLKRLAPARTLRLAALTAADTADFVKAFGRAENGRFIQWLFDETGGHPFYLVETLNELQERDALRLVPGADGGAFRLQVTAIPGAEAASGASTPQKIRQLIRGRLRRLSPPAFDLLAAGAVLAQGIGFDLLRRVAGVDESEGLRALDELLEGQLLQEQAGETAVATLSSYIFAHDNIRRVVYQEAGDARRRVFHRRALAALAEAGAAAAQLAHHALAAGDREAAFRHSLVAGDEALHLYAVREAIDHYEQARLVSNQLAVNGDRLRRLYMQLGRAYEMAGDYDAALAVYDELQAKAEERSDKPLQLAALMARTTVYAAPTQHYDPESVDILTQQALPLAQELDDHAAEAKIQWNLMLLHIFTGNMRDALEHGEASLAIVRAHDLREQLAYTLHDLYRPYLFCGHPEEALDALQEAQALWRELDNRAMLADNLNALAGHHTLTGAYDQALAIGAEALELSDEIDNVWNQSFGRMHLSFIYQARGEYTTAIELMESSIELGEAAGFMIPLLLNGALLAWIYALLGDLEQGFAWTERALQRADQMHPSLRISPLAAQGYLHVLAGDLAAAETAVSEALDLFSPDKNDPSLLLVPYAVAELALAKEEPEEALAQLERFFQILAERRIRLMTGGLYWLRARALRRLGRLQEAEAALNRAQGLAEKMRERPIWWRALAMRAELAEEWGEAETAIALRRQAAQIIRAIAEDLADPALYERFLEQTAVRAVLAAT